MGERVSGLLGAYVVPGQPSEWSVECAVDGRDVLLDVRWPVDWVADPDDPYLIRDGAGERMARARDRLVLSGEVTTVGARPTLIVDGPPEVLRLADDLAEVHVGWRERLSRPEWSVLLGVLAVPYGVFRLAVGLGLAFVGWFYVALGALSFVSGFVRIVERRRGAHLPAPLGWIAWTTRPLLKRRRYDGY